MLKRVQINGFIEIPEGAELPETGTWVTIGEFKAEVTGDSREKQKRQKGQVEMVYTAKLPLPEGAQILKIEEPDSPLFDEEGREVDAEGDND